MITQHYFHPDADLAYPSWWKGPMVNRYNNIIARHHIYGAKD